MTSISTLFDFMRGRSAPSDNPSKAKAQAPKPATTQGIPLVGTQKEDSFTSQKNSDKELIQSLRETILKGPAISLNDQLLQETESASKTSSREPHHRSRSRTRKPAKYPQY